MKKTREEYRAGAVKIAELTKCAPTEGMMVIVSEEIKVQGRSRNKTRKISGRVMAVNNRIFTVETEGFERMESFHLCDLAAGKLKVRVAG